MTRSLWRSLRDRVSAWTLLKKPKPREWQVWFDGSVLEFYDGARVCSADRIVDELLPLMNQEQVTGLRVHYRGLDVWVHSAPKNQRKWHYELSRRMPPGRSLEDYHISFSAMKDHQLVGLVPKSALDPIFQLAEKAELDQCSVHSIPLNPERANGSIWVTYPEFTWHLEVSSGMVSHIRPIHKPEELNAEVEHVPDEGATFLFNWADPKQEVRQKTLRDRRFLKQATVVVSSGLILLLFALWGMELWQERRLELLSVDVMKKELQAKHYRDKLEQYQAVISELEVLAGLQGVQVPVAVSQRQMLAKCPSSFVVTNLLYERAGQRFSLQGYAPDSNEMGQYLENLRSQFPNSTVDLIAFKRVAEELKDRLLLAKGVQVGMYQFQVVVNWAG